METLKRNAKAWTAGLAFLLIVGIQAAMTELTLTPTQTGWSRIALAVLMAGSTYGVWRIPNAPQLPQTAAHRLKDE